MISKAFNKLFNIKNTSYSLGRYSYKSKKRTEAQAPSSSNSNFSRFQNRGGDDVHSRRFQQYNQLEEDKMFGSQAEQYKIMYNRAYGSTFVNLDDVNIINIENTDTFDRTPQLAHNLNTVVHKPGIYPIDSLAPLQPDGAEGSSFDFEDKWLSSFGVDIITIDLGTEADVVIELHESVMIILYFKVVFIL